MLPWSSPYMWPRSIYNAHMIQYYSKHKNGTLAQSCFYNIMYAYKTLLPKTKLHFSLLLYNIAQFGNFVLKICINAKYKENKR